MHCGYRAAGFCRFISAWFECKQDRSIIVTDTLMHLFDMRFYWHQKDQSPPSGCFGFGLVVWASKNSLWSFILPRNAFVN